MVCFKWPIGGTSNYELARKACRSCTCMLCAWRHGLEAYTCTSIASFSFLSEKSGLERACAGFRSPTIPACCLIGQSFNPFVQHYLNMFITKGCPIDKTMTFALGAFVQAGGGTHRFGFHAWSASPSKLRWNSQIRRHCVFLKLILRTEKIVSDNNFYHVCEFELILILSRNFNSYGFPGSLHRHRITDHATSDAWLGSSATLQTESTLDYNHGVVRGPNPFRKRMYYTVYIWID